MKYLKFLQPKIFLLELRLRHAIKTLPLRLKVVLLFLLALFVASAFLFLRELDRKLSIEIPAEGGVLREGIIGTPRFINPVLTISDADRDLVMLVYSGLMRASGNQLILDLAERYEISQDGLCYTFFLKPDLKWSDGRPLTSQDIIFTIDQIKNPLNKSPNRASWEGVTAVQIDERQVQFCLVKPYAPFLGNTTIGILPGHIWKNMLPEQMPLSDFNIKPIGSGPYTIETVTRDSSGIITSYTLAPNKYFALGKSYIKKILLKFYPSEKKLTEAYQAGAIDSLSAVSPKTILEVRKANSVLKTYLLPRIFAVFFNQDNSSLFAESEVRKALNLSADKDLIIDLVLRGFGLTIDGPIPPESSGYLKPEIVPKDYQTDLEEAQNLLKKNGWKLNEETNVLEKTKSKKEKLQLKFTLSTSNIPDLVQAADFLKQNWEKLGAQITVKIYEIGDLEQNVIRPRKYDALLFGEILGRDPDVFAFWHSSQRNDPGLNVALYANLAVDKILEETRVTFDEQEREAKYKKLQEEIQKDAPAVFLYSPYFIHLVPVLLGGVDEKAIIISSERFSQIYNWYLQTKKVWKIFSD